MYTCTDNRNGGNGESFVPLSCENHLATSNPPAHVTTDSESATQDNNSISPSIGSSPVGAIVGSMLGCAVVAAAIAVLIPLAAAVYKHKKKHHSHDMLFNNNHARIDGKLPRYYPSRFQFMESQLSCTLNCTIYRD